MYKHLPPFEIEKKSLSFSKVKVHFANPYAWDGTAQYDISLTNTPKNIFADFFELLQILRPNSVEIIIQISESFAQR